MSDVPAVMGSRERHEDEIIENLSFNSWEKWLLLRPL
jgi:hypothetical protein